MIGDSLHAFLGFSDTWLPRIAVTALISTLLCFVIAIFVTATVRRNKAKKFWGPLRRSRSKKAKGIILGRIPGRLVFLPTGAEGHVACFGGSGSGKTSALVIPTLRSWDGTALVIDISGDIERKIPTFNKAVIAPYGDSTHKFDVLYFVDNANDLGEQNERLQALSFTLIPSKPTTDDTAAFYQEESRKLLQSALVAYYHAGLDFVQICKQVLKSTAEFLLEDINASGNELALDLAAGFEGGNEKTLSATKQEVDKAIMLFATNDKVAAVVGRGGISPATLENKSIFLNIPDEKLELLAPLLRLVTSQTFEYLSARAEDKNSPILLCLDEFVSFGKMDILPALRKLRKRWVNVMILTQSLADLDLIYGIPERRAMLDNIKYKLVLEANEFDTQKYFSDLSGEKIVIRASRTDNPSNGGSFTETEQTEKLIKPEQLAPGELENYLYLFYPGGVGVMKLKKNFYYEKHGVRSFLSQMVDERFLRKSR